MIQVRNVVKTFGNNTVLKGVSLDVHDGTTRVILGLSGSGKSVLMKHIIGLMRPDAGEILVDGEDITQKSHRQILEMRRKFGMVFQDAALFDSMTVFDNVAFPLIEHTDLTPEQIEETVHERLTMLNLMPARDRFPSQISGGMRKRVGLARAVILDPRYILYDEPTTGLDPIMTVSVDEMIRDAASRLKVTSLVISHDIGSALKIADDIAVIHQGEIIEDCKPAEIRKSKHPFVRQFLDAWFGKQ